MCFFFSFVHVLVEAVDCELFVAILGVHPE